LLSGTRTSALKRLRRAVAIVLTSLVATIGAVVAPVASSPVLPAPWAYHEGFRNSTQCKERGNVAPGGDDGSLNSDRLDLRRLLLSR